jgi:hypothetical protein
MSMLRLAVMLSGKPDLMHCECARLDAQPGGCG